MLFRKIVLIIVALCTVNTDGAFCATARRGGAAATGGTVPKTMSARAATNVRTSPVAGGTAGRTTAARSATPTKSAPKAPVVSARAATNQSVIGTGTKVSGAVQNTVVGDDCQKLYNACMDTFCVAHNVDGGRCSCSDKYRTFNKYWTEIDDLNQQAYKLQTVGVESIEAVVSKNPALQTPVMSVAKKAEIKNALENGDMGGALKQTAHDACVKQIPQCKDKMTVLSAMYSGQINGDCIAYENSLKKLKNEAKQRLTNAERGLQEIALDSAKSANKYDLGQCTIKFRECMAGKDVCGADFTGCVNVAEQTNVRIRNMTDEEIFVIPDTTANLTLSKSMHDLLLARSVICQPVLENCVNVADSVFNTFLREAYPQLRIAEDLAESNARQNCITKVSDCFRNACRDNIDPNDKDVSYDACLTRPEMMLSFCKVELNTCGVDSTDANAARKSDIWDYVLARLAAMKVDACTTDLKDCLVDENRCGADYSKCVGLGTEQIIRMCPYDKLVGCKNVYDKDLSSNEVYENLNNVVQGIILNIDNEMLATCQAAVDAAAKRVCGENLECGSLVNLDTIGTTSLDYKICEVEIDSEMVSTKDKCYLDVDLIPDVDLGRVEGATTDAIGKIITNVPIIEPMIYWENLIIGFDGMLTGVDDYIAKIDEEGGARLSDLQRERLTSELLLIQRGITSVRDAIHEDPIIDACINGRQIDGYDFKKVGRFPNITNSTIIMLSNKLLQRAKNNYYAKYDEYTEKSMKDVVKISERIYEIRNENAKDVRRETARQSCVNFAEMSALPKQKYKHQAKAAGEILVSTGGALLATAAAWLAVPFAGIIIAVIQALVGGAIAIAGSVTAGAGAAVEKDAMYKNTTETSIKEEYMGAYKITEFNYQEDITTVFDPTNLTCEKCVVKTQCEKVINASQSYAECKQWGKPSPKTCTTIQF